MTAAKLDELWDVMDIDKSNTLDREETKNFMAVVINTLKVEGESNDMNIDYIFERFDINHDQHLDKEEVSRFIKHVTGQK